MTSAGVNELPSNVMAAGDGAVPLSPAAGVGAESGGECVAGDGMVGVADLLQPWLPIPLPMTSPMASEGIRVLAVFNVRSVMCLFYICHRVLTAWNADVPGGNILKENAHIDRYVFGLGMVF